MLPDIPGPRTPNRLPSFPKVDPDWLPPDHDHKRDPRVRVARRIRYRHDERGWIGDAFNQLFVVDLESGETRQLTDGEGDCSGPVWSPRGDRLAYLCDEVEDRDFNNHSEARVIAASGGRPQTWSAGLWRVLALAWAADGSRLAASGTHDVLMWDPRQASIFHPRSRQTSPPPDRRLIHHRSAGAGDTLGNRRKHLVRRRPSGRIVPLPGRPGRKSDRPGRRRGEVHRLGARR